MDLDECEFLPTAFLPKDWFWCQYGDGSGSLRSPDGKHLFIYDLAPYHAEGGIEYQKTVHSRWNVFWGTFDEYKKYAERRVKTEMQEE